MHFVRGWHLVAILLLSPGVASAQTNWPDYMSQLHPGLSQSPASVMVWSANIEPPSPDVPVDKARWSGSWSGWACPNQVCETKLVVERVTTEGASIIYGFASDKVNPFTARLEARFVGGELQATLQTGSKLAYRMRKEGDLEFMALRTDGEWTVGVLSKVR
jgi:hypothetical protein